MNDQSIQTIYYTELATDNLDTMHLGRELSVMGYMRLRLAIAFR